MKAASKAEGLEVDPAPPPFDETRLEGIGIALDKAERFSPETLHALAFGWIGFVSGYWLSQELHRQSTATFRSEACAVRRLLDGHSRKDGEKADLG